MTWQETRRLELERQRMLRDAHSPVRFGLAVLTYAGLAVVIALVVGFWLGSLSH